MKIISEFTLYNARGQSIIAESLAQWRDPENPENDIFGPPVKYSWKCGEEHFERVRAEGTFWYLLPDRSGFITFERKFNHCFLLDVYGENRIQLNVPIHLIGREIPKTADVWFVNISSPFVNPLDGVLGKFGLSAWIEFAGEYYFELDCHRGEFLWATQIRV